MTKCRLELRLLIFTGSRAAGVESGCSSVDRVLASEAKGRGFDPRQPRQEPKLRKICSSIF